MSREYSADAIAKEEAHISALKSLEDEAREEGNTSLAWVWERARVRSEKELARMKAHKEATR